MMTSTLNIMSTDDDFDTSPNNDYPSWSTSSSSMAEASVPTAKDNNNNNNNDDHHESQNQNKSEYYPVHSNI
jgi:hypothetical protein